MLLLAAFTSDSNVGKAISIRMANFLLFIAMLSIFLPPFNHNIYIFLNNCLKKGSYHMKIICYYKCCQKFFLTILNR